jgi:ornithine cyclodeaminase/alanine dehydrogenase-like protein (mu-crystallin family)
MRFFPAEDVDAALDFPSLIEALSQAMSGGFVAPRRYHHEIEPAGEAPAMQPLMPGWTEGGSAAGDYLGAKIVNVFPGNSARGVPVVAGLYLLQSGRTGETLAAIDGTRLTLWRTARRPRWPRVISLDATRRAFCSAAPARSRRS